MSENNTGSSDTKNTVIHDSKDNKTAPNVDEQTESIKLEDKWMIRDCDIYKDEYNECTGFRPRFHQYFIFGEALDCNQWKKDYDNCCKWVSKGDVKAAEEVIKSEQVRRLERLRGHYQNDVWKKRDQPPPDWDKPLPEWMAKRDENTYLAHKAKEMKEGNNEENTSSCVIM